MSRSLTYNIHITAYLYLLKKNKEYILTNFDRWVSNDTQTHTKEQLNKKHENLNKCIKNMKCINTKIPDR